MYNNQINSISVNSDENGYITTVYLIHVSGKKYNYEYKNITDINKVISSSIKQCLIDYTVEQRINKIQKIKERL